MFSLQLRAQQPHLTCSTVRSPVCCRVKALSDMSVAHVGNEYAKWVCTRVPSLTCVLARLHCSFDCADDRRPDGTADRAASTSFADPCCHYRLWMAYQRTLLCRWTRTEPPPSQRNHPDRMPTMNCLYAVLPLFETSTSRVCSPKATFMHGRRRHRTAVRQG